MATRRRKPAPTQRYYWTRRWQADEAASVAALEAGEGVEFDNAADLVAWLGQPTWA